MISDSLIQWFIQQRFTEHQLCVRHYEHGQRKSLCSWNLHSIRIERQLKSKQISKIILYSGQGCEGYKGNEQVMHREELKRAASNQVVKESRSTEVMAGLRLNKQKQLRHLLTKRTASHQWEQTKQLPRVRNWMRVLHICHPQIVKKKRHWLCIQLMCSNPNRLIMDKLFNLFSVKNFYFFLSIRSFPKCQRYNGE